MKTPLRFLKQNLDEITSHRVLSFYGCGLSIAHIVTFFFWNKPSIVNTWMVQNKSSLCWPHFPFCESLQLSSPAIAGAVLYVYLCISVLSALFFLHKKTVKVAYFFFLLALVAKYGIFLMDYRFMGNYHYMHFIISLLYLFIPQKMFFIPIFIVLFYFFAGLIKTTNREWLTGLALFKSPPVFINEEVFKILCFLVVLLETVGVWFLILKTRIREGIFFCFVMFHTVSYYFVGYYYPLIMFSLISIFPLKWSQKLGNEKLGSQKLGSEKPWSQKLGSQKSLSFLNRSHYRIGVVCLLVFCVCQFMPFLIKGDSSLTGEGRFFSLNMFDANTECRSQVRVRFKNRTVEIPLPHEPLEVRIHCDPYVYFYQAQKMCQLYKKNKNFKDLDLILFSKLKSDRDYTTLIDEKNFCAQKLSYSLYRKNKWIKITNKKQAGYIKPKDSKYE